MNRYTLLSENYAERKKLRQDFHKETRIGALDKLVVYCAWLEHKATTETKISNAQIRRLFSSISRLDIQDDFCFIEYTLFLENELIISRRAALKK
jgi:hypothetical protein